MDNRNSEEINTAPPPSFYGPWATAGLTAMLFALPNLVFIFIMAFPYFLGHHIKSYNSYIFFQQHRAFFQVFHLGLNTFTILVLAWLVRQKGQSPREYLALHQVRWRTTLLWVLPALLFTAAFIIVLAVFDWEPIRFISTSIEFDGIAEMHLMFWMVAIVGPIFEEFLFRGFLYQGLAQSRLGSHRAVWIIALIDTAMHTPINAAAIFAYLALSFYHAYMRRQTGSTLPGLLHHLLHNMIIFLLYAADQWGAIA